MKEIVRNRKALRADDVPSANSEARARRLMNKVVDLHHRTLAEHGEVQEQLKAWGVADPATWNEFKLGLADGRLLGGVPDAGEVRDDLKALRLLDRRGQETLTGSVVLPIWDYNRDCVDLVVFKEGKNGMEETRLLGHPSATLNWQAARRSKALILAPTALDCLRVFDAGFTEVMHLDPVNKDLVPLIQRYQVKELYLLPGRAARKTAERLWPRGVATFLLDLPEDSDLSDLLRGPEGPDKFEVLLKQVNPLCVLRGRKGLVQDQDPWERLDQGFAVQYGERRYEVRACTKEGTRLRATIKAMPTNSSQTGLKVPFHLDSVDLVSSRSRASFASDCAKFFNEKADVIDGDLLKLAERAEHWKPDAAPKAAPFTMTPAEEDEALELLKDPGLMGRIARDLEALGLVGEEGNKSVLYLSATSRKTDDPLSVTIQSRSAAGKSAIQSSVLQLMPPEDVVSFTRLTSQALYYMGEDALRHKVLAVEEGEGAREASYSLRNIQSAGQLVIATTGRDPATGRMLTEEYKVKGPVALLVTTTDVELDYETSNRFLTLTVDESKAMTERILTAQRERDTLKGLLRKSRVEAVARVHRNAQRLLRPLHVVNPFAPHLDFPSDTLRARRDHKKYLGLIRALAFLHQYQREVKVLNTPEGDILEYVEVTLDDIENANALAAEIMGRTLDELAPPSRRLLGIVKEMVAKRSGGQPSPHREYRFTRREVREFSHWSDAQVKAHVRQLEELEYIHPAQGSRGKEYVYQLLYAGEGDSGRRFVMGLADVAKLKNVAIKGRA